MRTTILALTSCLLANDCDYILLWKPHLPVFTKYIYIFPPKASLCKYTEIWRASQITHSRFWGLWLEKMRGFENMHSSLRLMFQKKMCWCYIMQKIWWKHHSMKVVDFFKKFLVIWRHDLWKFVILYVVCVFIVPRCWFWKMRRNVLQLLVQQLHLPQILNFLTVSLWSFSCMSLLRIHFIKKKQTKKKTNNLGTLNDSAEPYRTDLFSLVSSLESILYREQSRRVECKIFLMEQQHCWFVRLRRRRFSLSLLFLQPHTLSWGGSGVGGSFGM